MEDKKIMNKQREAINSYNEALFAIYKDQGLQCLSDNNYTYASENVLGINIDAVVMANQSGLYQRQIEIYDLLKIDKSTKNPNQMQMELISATADLKYRLGTLYLYHPYITRLEHSYSYIESKKFFHFNQRLEDARFNRELPVAFESLYKFWQRLGDYLCSFFPELLLDKKGMIYFQNPFQYIHNHFPDLENSLHFQWLWDFQQNVYPMLNKHRKFFVHQAGYDSDYVKKFLDAHSKDENAIIALDNERDRWLPYLHEQSELCNNGYLTMMRFLNQLKITKTAKGQFEYKIIV